MNIQIRNSFEAQAALTQRLVAKRIAVLQNMREMCYLLVRLKRQQENALWLLQYDAAGLETRKKNARTTKGANRQAKRSRSVVEVARPLIR